MLSWRHDLFTEYNNIIMLSVCYYYSIISLKGKTPHEETVRQCGTILMLLISLQSEGNSCKTNNNQ